MKTLLATTATLAVLSMGAAWAQSATEPQVDEPLIEETTPGAAMPADQVPETVVPQAGLPQAGAASFLAEQQEGHWLTSNLIGRNVLTPDGDSIGQVAALEIGPEGQVTSLVMTVGGFLGLGAGFGLAAGLETGDGPFDILAQLFQLGQGHGVQIDLGHLQFLSIGDWRRCRIHAGNRRPAKAPR